MKVLICPHTLELGGSQLNAIELADELRRVPGVQTAIYAPPGLLADEIRTRGIELINAPPRRTGPSVESARRLTGIVTSGGFDIVNPFEWNTTIDALDGPGWSLGTPVVSTILSMDVPYLVPRSVPLIVGTRQMQRDELRWRPDVHLMEPPVDTRSNAPGVVGAGEAARERWSIDPAETLLVAVCRLSVQLKLEGLLTVIEACGRVAGRHKIRLLIVGDGPARPQLEHAAATANSVAGRTVVQLVGERTDPRSYYDAADIVIGMGASALRGLAFAKPLLVQGEQGFWETLTPATLPVFLEQGWYGTGTGRDGLSRCEAELCALLDSEPAELTALGEMGRRVVDGTYSLSATARALAGLYEVVASRSTPARDRALERAESLFVRAKHAAAVRRHRIHQGLAGRFTP